MRMERRRRGLDLARAARQKQTMLSRVVALFCASLALAASLRPQDASPAAAEPPRRARVEAVLPEIDRVYRAFAEERHLPGVVHGVVLDGELIHAVALGTANLETRAPVARDTRFRIASMTKSFTAMAILRLRDAELLRLGDHVAKYLPELARLKPATTDAPPLRIEHLLTMQPGFPTDDPWGDRQLAMSRDALAAFLERGITTSNAPGTAFEYSNLAYALLGEIITRVSGDRYEDYITREILRPLGLRDTLWEYTEVPKAKLAIGYRWEDERWKPEPLLHDGTFGAMGGLITTLDDFARYVSFHLAAWPARDDEDRGPVSRATLREMHVVHGPVRVIAEARDIADQPLPANALGYAYGLISARDARGVFTVRHSGGLPGYGSNYIFCPELGVAVISFANRTYAPMQAVNVRALRLLIEGAKLTPRAAAPSAALEKRAREVAAVLTTAWQAPAVDIFAENFFLDRDRTARATESGRLLAQAGRVLSVTPVRAENRLRGSFALVAEHGRIEVALRLSPEAEARVQSLELRWVDARAAR